MKFLLLLALTIAPVLSFVPCHSSIFEQKVELSAQKESWDEGDNWSKLSSSSPENALDGASIFNIDPALEAARSMNFAESSEYQFSEEDDFITDAVDTIHSRIYDDSTGVKLYDTKETFDEYTKTETFFDEMGREISLLVRCNESPDNLLVSLGRKLRTLEDEEKYDVKQLFDNYIDVLDGKSKDYKPTEFFESAVQAMFHMHASPSTEGADSLLLTPKGVASWMSKSLGEKVGIHDRRVTITIAKYSTHGSGYLSQPQFMKLYMDAAALTTKKKKKRSVHRPNSRKDELPTVKSVWRDLENHGFQPPIVAERDLLQKEIDKEHGRYSIGSKKEMMDECEILEWRGGKHSTPRDSSTSQMQGATSTTKKSSHELVKLASDSKTPSRLRDGDFVFIDEESCIGCMQCVHVAPSSFKMLDNGRARTFQQSNMPEVDTAVSICPVGCMHKVSFHELKEMETSRDVKGNLLGRKYLGTANGHIPLNVARMDSDVNRKSSWYHTLKHKCFTSKSCPQKGCFDCPMYDTPGGNPYAKRIHKKAEHIRAEDLIKSGEANRFRNIADL